MTLVAAWTRDLSHIGPQVVLAADSLIRGGFAYPHATKLMAFNRRGDCVLGWAGDVALGYTFALNAANAIEYADALSGRGTDVEAVMRMAESVFSDLWAANLNDPGSVYKDVELEFLLCAYSHRAHSENRAAGLWPPTKVWHIRRHGDERYVGTQVTQFPYFIGSGATEANARMRVTPVPAPYAVLKEMIDDGDDEVGGYPQVVTVDRRGIEAIAVECEGMRHLFGRPLPSGYVGHTRTIACDGSDL